MMEMIKKNIAGYLSGSKVYSKLGGWAKRRGELVKCSIEGERHLSMPQRKRNRWRLLFTPSRCLSVDGAVDQRLVPVLWARSSRREP